MNFSFNQMTKSTYLHYLFVLGVVVLYYSLFEDSFHYSISWDDTKHLMNNPIFQNINYQTFTHFWTEPYFGMFIPVAYDLWGLLLWLMRDLLEFDFDTIVMGFRIVNWLLHGLNFFLLYAILRNLSNKKTYSLLASSLFLFHPLNSELVLWISEFRGLLAMFFVLCAAYCFVKDYQFHFQHSWLFYLAPICLILGSYSKPNVVVFLLGTFIYSLMYRRTILPITYSLITLLLGIVPGVMVVGVQTGNSPVEAYGLVERFIVSGFSLVFYVQKLFFPFSLSHVYPENLSTITSLNSAYFLVSVLLLLGLVVWLKFRVQWLLLVFAGVITIAPNLGFIPFSYQEYSLVANRYAYPLVAVIVVLIYLIQKPKLSFNFKILIAIIFGSLITSYSLEIQNYKSRWGNESMLWTQELIEQPTNQKIRVAWTKAFYDPLVSSFISLNKSPGKKEFKQLYYEASSHIAPYSDNLMDRESHAILNKIKPWIHLGDFDQVSSYFDTTLVAHKTYHKSVIRLAALSYLHSREWVQFQKYYSRYLRGYGTPSNMVLKEIYQLLLHSNKMSDASAIIYRGLLKSSDNGYWINELRLNKNIIPLHMRLKDDGTME